MTPPAITLTDVTLTHDRRPAVHHLSGAFEAGSLTAIIGPNGAGKSTLLRAIAGLHRVAEGRIEVDRRQVGLLPQASGLDRGFPMTCLETVALGRARRAGPFAPLGAGADHAAHQALHAVGLGGFETRVVGGLSAGQFQRLLFARLMVEDATLVLLDEPFNAVDSRTSADLLAVIDRWHAEGRTVIAVLHDHELVARHFPATLLLARHCIAWGPTDTVLRPEALGRARLAAEAWSAEPEICRSAA